MNLRTDTLAELEARVRTILPELYQDSYEDVQPVSMGSASLKYGSDGKVTWDQMWDTFCDLAMAGGPPHKGTLLRPATPEEITAQPARYQEAAGEICRGITLVSDLRCKASKFPGWVQVRCDDLVMTEWLVRAIVMENVSAHCEGESLYLPAGPAYRIEKEIKNVITVVAKTCHYWVDHMWMSQQREITALFQTMAADTPLLTPLFPATQWSETACPDVDTAIWLMRALVASNVLARREGTTLFMPVNYKLDPGGVRAAKVLAHVQALASSRTSYTG